MSSPPVTFAPYCNASRCFSGSLKEREECVAHSSVLTCRELLLNNNYLRVLPYELGKLFQLQVLGLKGNPLTKEILALYQEVNGTHKLLSYMMDNLQAREPSLFFGVVHTQWIALWHGSVETRRQLETLHHSSGSGGDITTTTDLTFAWVTQVILTMIRHFRSPPFLHFRQAAVRKKGSCSYCWSRWAPTDPLYRDWNEMSQCRVHHGDQQCSQFHFNDDTSSCHHHRPVVLFLLVCIGATTGGRASGAQVARRERSAKWGRRAAVAANKQVGGLSANTTRRLASIVSVESSFEQ
ncbi:hypothetical protein B566_EDAN010416 [Ephemera danica]|nr:hypothetical protein B566_EDAN010416 [Ephemera danica]